MKQDTLYTTYADLLTEQADPQYVQLVQELDSIANASYPPENVNWTQVRLLHAEQIEQKMGKILPELSLAPGRSLERSRRPLLRKAIVIPAAIALVLMIAAASTPLLLARLSQSDPQPPPRSSDPPFTYINQASTFGHGKDMVVLVNGYADSNQIILEYDIAPSVPYTISQSDLNWDGVELPAQGSSVFMDYNQNILVTTLSFNSSAITGHPQDLPLQLHMQLAPTSHGQANTSTTKPATTQQNLSPATFKFTLPFHPSRVIEPQERVVLQGPPQDVAQGMTITLEQVVISQSATRIVVQGLKPFPHTTQPQPSASDSDVPDTDLQIPNARDTNYALVGYDASGTYTFIYPYVSFQSQGTWKLTVRQWVNNSLNSWDFYFVVPPAS